MPLQRDVPDPTSVNLLANAYIQIDKIELDARAKYYRIVLGAYRDKAAADARKAPVYSMEYTIAGGRAPDPTVPGDVGAPTYAAFLTANAAVFTNLRKISYDFVVTQPELTGATTVP